MVVEVHLLLGVSGEGCEGVRVCVCVCVCVYAIQCISYNMVGYISGLAQRSCMYIHVCVSAVE